MCARFLERTSALETRHQKWRVSIFSAGKGICRRRPAPAGQARPRASSGDCKKKSRCPLSPSPSNRSQSASAEIPHIKVPGHTQHDSSGGPGRCASINTAEAVRLWVGGRHLHGQIRQPVLTVRPFLLELLWAGRGCCPLEAAVRVGAAENEKGAKGVSGRCVVRGW